MVGAIQTRMPQLESLADTPNSEQQRLLKRKLAFEKRLRLMASRRAAGADNEVSDSPPVPAGAADEGSE